MPANAANIRATLARTKQRLLPGGNENVALVLDGVAGMFQATTDRQEVAYLLKRKGAPAANGRVHREDCIGEWGIAGARVWFRTLRALDQALGILVP
eukprot:Skav234980  [mRNA]  locus=scaffold122:161646:163347:+ [translate_table: standard]